VVIIRFGHDWDPTCMKMDEVCIVLAFIFQTQTLIRCTSCMIHVRACFSIATSIS